MADITNKNELKRRIELFLDDELDYSINEDFCKETMKMMREFIGHASHRLDCEESRVKSLKKKLKEYNGGWIPCSERLPEEAFGCLITVMDCEPSTQTDFKNILPCFVGYDGETWNDADGNVIPFEVIAWMPLPQPYQYAIGKTDSSKMRSQNKS